jgi:tetratricopeptide (TPR) repeat protein
MSGMPELGGVTTKILSIAGWGMALVLVQTWPAAALRPEEVAKIAKPVTVLIETADSNGSGIIVDKAGDRYTVLTAAHVTNDRNQRYTITTNDGERHQLNPANTQVFSQRVDLAVTSFTSKKNYPIAKIGNSDRSVEGSMAFVSGYPRATLTITNSVYSFRDGRIIANSAKPLAGGYAIVYSAHTLPGMSGGGVFNENGELIAIHGRGDIDPTIKPDAINPNIRFKTGNDLGIPINTFVTLAKSQPQINLPAIASNPLPPRPARSQPTAGDFFVVALGKYQESDYQGAVDNYSKAIKVKAKFSEAYVNRGLVKAELGDTKGSLADQNAAFDIDPNQPAVYVNRGVLMYQAGNLAGAIGEYTQALKFDQSDPLVYFDRAIAYADSNKLNEAIADYSQAINYFPKFMVAYYNRGNAKSRLNQYVDAIKDYSQVLQLSPNYIQALNNRGNALLKTGDNMAALADYSQAIAIKPDYASAYANRASAKFNLRQRRSALQDLQTAAVLYQKQGDQKKYQETLAVYQRLGSK